VVGRRLAWPSSALLSGLIVAFVLGPETAHWVTLCVAMLATASKHLLKTSRAHVFNPAALAVRRSWRTAPARRASGAYLARLERSSRG